MLHNLRTNKILWSITTLLTLIAAIAGILIPHLYNRVFPEEFIPGALPQDILTVIICLVTFFLISRMKEKNMNMQIIVMGIIGSFFYLYGIFAIERVYNFLYLIYLGVFAISSWSLIYSLMSINTPALKNIKLSKTMTYVSSIVALCIAVLFIILWTSALMPLMRDRNRIEYLYSIYILDLCFIMPAFILTSVLALRKKPLGIVLLPAVYIVGFFVIFPLGLGEIAKPYYGQITNYPSMTMAFLLAAVLVGCGSFHILKIKK